MRKSLRVKKNFYQADFSVTKGIDASKEFCMRKMDSKDHAEQLKRKKLRAIEKDARAVNPHLHSANSYAKKAIRAGHVSALGSATAAVGLIPGCNVLIVPGSIISAAGKGAAQYYRYFENSEKVTGEKEIAEGIKVLRERWDNEIIPMMLSDVELPKTHSLPEQEASEALLTQGDHTLTNDAGLEMAWHEDYSVSDLQKKFDGIQQQIKHVEEQEEAMPSDDRFEWQTALTRLLGQVGQLRLEGCNEDEQKALVKLEKQIEKLKENLTHTHKKNHHHCLEKAEEEHSISRDHHASSLEARDRIKKGDKNKHAAETAGKVAMAFAVAAEVGESVGAGVEVLAALGHAYNLEGLEGAVGEQFANTSKVTQSVGKTGESTSDHIERDNDKASEESIESANSEHARSLRSGAPSLSSTSSFTQASDTVLRDDFAITKEADGQVIAWHDPDLAMIQEEFVNVGYFIQSLKPENEKSTIIIAELQDKIVQMESYLEQLQDAPLSRQEERRFECFSDRIKILRKDLKKFTNQVHTFRLEQLEKEKQAFVDYKKKRAELEAWIRENNEFFKNAKTWEKRKTWCRRGAAASAVVGVAGAWNGICAIAGGLGAGILGLASLGSNYEQRKNLIKGERVLEDELEKQKEEFFKLHPVKKPFLHAQTATTSPEFESPKTVADLYNLPLMQFTPLEPNMASAASG